MALTPFFRLTTSVHTIISGYGLIFFVIDFNWNYGSSLIAKQWNITQYYKFEIS